MTRHVLHTTIGLLGLASSGLAAPAAASGTLQVLDETNRGVPSEIVANTGGDEWKHLAYTDDSGTAQVTWSCETGARVRAKPGDGGTYFNSPPADCGTRGPLRVPFRIRGGRLASSVAISEITSPEGGRFYFLVGSVVGTRSIEHPGWADATPGASSHCSFSVNGTVTGTLYRASGDGAWQAVEAGAAENAGQLLARQLNAETLPTTCAAASTEIQRAEKAALPLWRATVWKLSGSLSDAVAAQLGGEVTAKAATGQ
jgi:hypothetical protein